MKDVRLLAIAVFIFMVLPLLSRTISKPYPPQPELKVSRRVLVNDHQLPKGQCNQSKPMKKCDEKNLEACSVTVIPYIWTIHYHCSGEGFGGGGGRAF